MCVHEKEEEEASQARFQISLGVTQFFFANPPFEVSALAKQDPFCMSSPCAYHHQRRRHILHYTHKRTHESVVTGDLLSLHITYSRHTHRHRKWAEEEEEAWFVRGILSAATTTDCLLLLVYDMLLIGSRDLSS